ncbi:MAG: hypothetical protein HZA53_08100 [Planctomycetes bacterium]|nr:hypothetical protein [Planctomycetota bacterium]
MSRKTPKHEHELLGWFEYCGYVRQVDPKRRAKDGQLYKKGYEVRFVVPTLVQAYAIQRLLRETGFEPGRPYAKHSRLVQPAYGRDVVEWFLERLPADGAGEELGFAENGRRTVRRPSC